MRVVAVLAAMLVLQESPELLLRTRYSKGEKVRLAFRQIYKVKVEEVPEEFADLLGEEPVEVKVSGEAALEVTEIREDGTAVLEGRTRKLKADGHFILNDIVFDYDRERDGDTPKDEPDEGPGTFGVNPSKALHALAKEPIRLTVSPRNQVAVLSRGEADGYAERMFDLGGISGALPEAKVAAGGTWKSEDGLRLPNLPIRVKIAGEHALEKIEGEGAARAAKIRSKYRLASEEAEEREGDVKLKLEGGLKGEGEGSSEFLPESGRMRRQQAKLSMKATLKVPTPAGEDVTLKGKVEIEQSLELTGP